MTTPQSMFSAKAGLLAVTGRTHWGFSSP